MYRREPTMLLLVMDKVTVLAEVRVELEKTLRCCGCNGDDCD
jgi:hypothetical protein